MDLEKLQAQKVDLQTYNSL